MAIQPLYSSEVRRRAASARVRVADAAYHSGQLEATCRLDEKLLEFLRTFAISPIANPYQVRRVGVCDAREEQPCVGSLVPSEYLAPPSTLEITLPQDLAECQHRVVVVQCKIGDGCFVGSGAMVGVVKQQREIGRRPA